MQDFQPFPGLTDRIFTSSGSETTRRVRVFPSSSSTTQQQQQQQQHPQAPTKCPRCESANTKFCYYNNYNLSQPRHFCKSCRRYWTKGGVLRNVPVGGGCRKNNSKRSSKSSSSSSKPDKKARRKPPAAASGSSSESSSTLTASNPNPNPNPNPDPILEGPIFPEGAGSFSSLIIGQQGPGGFSFSDPSLMSGFRVGDPGAERKVEEEEEQEAVDLQVNGSGLDWSGSLFDITSSVDPAAYWNQNQWVDADPSLFLP